MDYRVGEWHQKKIYLGTSSWKYNGWKGMIYNGEYKSDKDFKERCLEEYTSQFSCVGVDHTFYAWPRQSTFEKYKKQVPTNFKLGLKVTEKLTVFKYPKFKRYGKEAGKKNTDFLNADLFQEAFLEPLIPFRSVIGPVMLEFSQFFPGTVSSGSEFVEHLDRFFSEIGETPFQLAVEIRNKGWLKPPYFKMLSKHKVAHVYNSWTRMPSLKEQLDASEDYKPPCFVSRILLKPGRTYENAVESFSPYDKIQDKQPEIRKDAAALIERAIEFGVPAYIFVNNRCEGSAPLTIQGILDKLSPKH